MSACWGSLQSLGVTFELREAGYAHMCMGYLRSGLVLETVDEDEPEIYRCITRP